MNLPRTCLLKLPIQAAIFIAVFVVGLPAAFADVTAANALLQAGDGPGAITLLEEEERGGNSEAVQLLGEIYYNGLAGTPVDHARGCDKFEIAALAGQPEGQHNLGNCYYIGNGRRVDPAKAAIWYRKSVGAGFPKAFCALGNMIVLGDGFEADPAGGMRLCLQGADAGDADAQTDVAQYYLFGEHFRQDFAKAIRYLTLAADQDQPTALFLLGLMHWNGDGVEKSQHQAATFWDRAAGLGHPGAPFHLANYYYLSSIIDIRTRQIDLDRARTAHDWYQTVIKVDSNSQHKAAAGKRITLLESLIGAATRPPSGGSSK